MKVFKLFKIFREGVFLYYHSCKVNSDKNFKRKEMKHNYSPLDNKYKFRLLLHALYI